MELGGQKKFIDWALVTTEQMAAYMEAAGLESVFDPVGLFDRGLFICRPAK